MNTLKAIDSEVETLKDDCIKGHITSEQLLVKLTSLRNAVNSCKQSNPLLQNYFVALSVAMTQMMSLITHSIASKDEQKRKDIIPVYSHNTRNEGQQRQQAIEATIQSSEGSADFSAVVGLDDVKQTIKEALTFSSKYPDLFGEDGVLKPWTSILLYGPPGTGKSFVAQAVAKEVNSTFYSVSSSDLVSSWMGESEKLIRELFAHAKQSAELLGKPSIIFLDEVDSLCRHRTSSEQDNVRRIKTELLIRTEELKSDKGTTVFVICATNCPFELDKAFLRRFEKRVYVRLPTKEARIKILQKRMGKVNDEVSAEQWNKIGEATEGFSGSDLACLFKEAVITAIRRYEALPKGSDGKICRIKVGFQDLQISVDKMSKTISSHDVEKFEKFQQMYC